MRMRDRYRAFMRFDIHVGTPADAYTRVETLPRVVTFKGEFGYSRGSYWIVLPNGLKQSTKVYVLRENARERFRYMLRNELNIRDADAIIETIDARVTA